MDLQTGLQIGLAVLFLAACFAMYLSSKTWQWTHVVLIFFVFLASGVFWYLSAAVLKIHHSYRSQVNTLQAEVDQLTDENEALRHGTRNEELLAAMEAQGVRLSRGSIRQARHDLKKMLLDRGRMWVDAQPTSIGGDGVAEVAIETPVPHGIEAGTTLFAFEQGPIADGTHYLGEFKVTAAAEGAVTIQPTTKLSGRQLGQLTASKTAWTLYEVMPIDRHNVFLNLEDAELAELVPEPSLPEYQKDNKPAAAEDPEERVVGYKKDGTRATDEESDKVVEKRYVRELRDYGYIFHQLHTQEAVDLDTLAQLKVDAKLLQEAIEKVKKDIAYRESEKGKLTSDKEKFAAELATIQKHLEQLEARHAAVRARLRAVFFKNRELAADLAAEQARLTAEINGKTVPVPAQGANQLQTSTP